MPDQDDEFEKAFDGFGDDSPATPPADPVIEPPKEEEKKDAPKSDDTGVPAENPAEPNKEEQPVAPSDNPDDKKPGPDNANGDSGKSTDDGAKDKSVDEGNKDTEVAAQPLTKADVESVVSNLLTNERAAGRELSSTTEEVIEKFYPKGLSNVLTDESTGKELRTPQDVVDLTGWNIEKATQWYMNEQFKLDQQIAEIKSNAQKIAETTINFKRDAVAAVAKYEPLFKAYPHLQQKVFDKLMKQVKADEEKGFILSAPDVMEHYDDYLEPYQQAFEYGKQQPATNPPLAPPAPPAPPKPTTEDRLDETGDAGPSPVIDPNDFASVVANELKKGI